MYRHIKQNFQQMYGRRMLKNLIPTSQFQAGKTGNIDWKPNK